MRSHGPGNYVAKKPKKDDKEQSKRFIDKAKELDSDESGKSFKRVIENIPKTKPQTNGD